MIFLSSLCYEMGVAKMVLLGLSLQAVFQPVATAEHTLTLELDNVTPNKGSVQIAIYNSPATWMIEKKVFHQLTVKASGALLRISIPNLKDGDYAIAVFQDENENQILDTNFLGVPLEKIGFSNNVRPMFSSPTFSQCKFSIKGATTHRIRLFHII